MGRIVEVSHRAGDAGQGVKKQGGGAEQIKAEARHVGQRRHRMVAEHLIRNRASAITVLVFEQIRATATIGELPPTLLYGYDANLPPLLITCAIMPSSAGSLST